MEYYLHRTTYPDRLFTMAPNNPGKRRRDTSPVTVGGSNPFSLSLARSSLAPHLKHFDSLQVPPRKRVNSYLPSAQGSPILNPNNTNPTTPLSRATSHVPQESVAVTENDDDIRDREEDDFLDKVVMAVDMREKGTVGCCYYVAREEKLYMMDDIKYGEMEVIDACMFPLDCFSRCLLKSLVTLVKLHVQPTTILLSSRIDERVEAHLDHKEMTSHRTLNGDGI